MSAVNVIPAQRVQVVKPSAPPLIHQECKRESRISVIKDGDTVRVIEIACSCGEIIRLDCAYER
jgi:hypothetical protein